MSRERVQYSECGNIHDTGNYILEETEESQGCTKNEDNYMEGTSEGTSEAVMDLNQGVQQELLGAIRSEGY